MITATIERFTKDLFLLAWFFKPLKSLEKRLKQVVKPSIMQASLYFNFFSS